MKIITEKELRYSAKLVAQGKLDEEETMVVSSQLNQAANLIEILRIKPTCDQCQKRDELIKAQDELIVMAMPQVEFCGDDSDVFLGLWDKVKQLKKEIQ